MNAVSSYLHYHIDSYDGPQGLEVNVGQIKKRVLDNFLAKFRSQQRSVNDGDLVTKQQAISFLREMSTGGLIGDKLIQDLSNIIFTVPGSQQSRIPTGGGLGSGDANLTIPEKAVQLLRQTNDKLNSIVDILSEVGDSVYLAMLADLKDGSILPPELSSKIPNNTQYTDAELKNKDSKFVNSISNLKKKMQELSALADGGTSDLSYNSILSSIRNNFNNIGGILYEVVTAYILNHSGYVAKEEIVDKGNTAFLRSGVNSNGDVSVTVSLLGAQRTGDKKIGIDKHEVKGDIELTIETHGTSGGTVTFNLNGQLKLLQNKQVLQGKPATVLRNLTGGVGFGEALVLTLNYMNSSYSTLQWFEAHMSAIKKNKDNQKDYSISKSSDVVQAWNDLRDACKYVVAAKILTGSGNFSQDDFASILIINNQIYSMYGILSQLNERFDELARFDNSFNATTLSGQRGQIMRVVKETAKESPKHKDWRNRESKAIIQRMYNKRATMTLYLSTLAYS